MTDLHDYHSLDGKIILYMRCVKSHIELNFGVEVCLNSYSIGKDMLCK